MKHLLIMLCITNLFIVKAQDFTLMVVPDPQFMVMDFSYQGSDLAQFTAQMDWIPAQKDALNIKFICNVGDVTDHADNNNEWTRFKAGWSKIENSGMPWSIAPGNHDTDLPMGSDSWNIYNSKFPASTWMQNAWAVETFPTGKNENNISFFSASGMEFMVLTIGYGFSQAEFNWATAKLAAYPNKRAIISCHDVNNGPIVDLAKQSTNVFLIVSGHYCGPEWTNTFVNKAGITGYEIMSDYQCGLNGYLRYYKFKPAENKIEAYTYSPIANNFRTGPTSQFSWSYTMSTSTTPSLNLSQTTVINEGAENGGKITATISNAIFTTTLNTANWTVTNLPAGVTKGAITRISDTQATITLNGNSTIGTYTNNITNITINIAPSEFVSATTNVTTNTGITLTKYEVPTADKTYANYDGTDLTFTGFGGSTFTKIPNTNKNGINTSNNVGEVVKINGSEVWAGITTGTLNEKINFSTCSIFKIKVYSPIIGTVLLKLEDAANNTIFKEVSTSSTKTNEWEELTFDFTGTESNKYNKIALFFDFGNTVGNTFYFDDLLQTISITTEIIQENLNSVYPNPVQQCLNVLSEDVVAYDIYDSKGVKVLEGNGFSVDVSFLSRGIYFISIGKEIHRFIKI